MFVLHEGKSKHLSPFKNRRIVTKAGSQQKIRGLTRKQAASASLCQAASSYPHPDFLPFPNNKVSALCLCLTTVLSPTLACCPPLPSLSVPSTPPGKTNRPTIPQLGRLLTFPLSPSHLLWLSCPGPHPASNAGSPSLWSVRHR